MALVKEKRSRGESGGGRWQKVCRPDLWRFDPPLIPQNFVPLHKFAAPLEYDTKAPNLPPPVVPPPEDNNLRILIEGLATLVARSGKLLEDLSREKNQFNPLFGFLNGGEGHEYYARKLWEERQKRNEQGKQQLDAKNSRQVQKMTAETRGQILGEKPIERSVRTANSPGISADAISLTSNLSDTFTKPASINELLESAKPFQDDPAKQERFEQFLKEKYHGGLRPKDSSGASNMSEAARARERLEFESVAETINKGKQGKGSVPPIELLSSTLATAGLQFTPGAAEEDHRSLTNHRVSGGLPKNPPMLVVLRPFGGCTQSQTVEIEGRAPFLTAN
ncbi:G patch domain-containing protein TGH -like protein [Capsicum chinense]|nr:G patch domain-containing protein TGH -like protein [Capsicum chinense]